VTAPTATELILVDSSGWLEILTNDSKANLFQPYFSTDPRSILISPIIIYEVRKLLLSRSGAIAADQFSSVAERYESIEINNLLARKAAALSLSHRLPMADALIYASASTKGAQLITSDAHFKDLPGVTLL
jgi:predicted nucleic acid-binding protein